MILQHWPTSLCSYHTISIIRCLIEYHRKYLLLKYLLITEVSSSQVRSIFGLERVGLVEWIYSCDKPYYVRCFSSNHLSPFLLNICTSSTFILAAFLTSVIPVTMVAHFQKFYITASFVFKEHSLGGYNLITKSFGQTSCCGSGGSDDGKVWGNRPKTSIHSFTIDLCSSSMIYIYM